MDNEEIVLKIRGKRNFEELQVYFAKHPKKLEELIQLVTNEEPYPLEEYGSWILVHLCKTQPEQIQPYYNHMVDIAFKSRNQSVMRNVVNVVHHLKITDYRESEYVDLLINFVQDYENKVAVQVYSIYVLAQFVKKYPELKPEILEIIDLHADGKSAAYRSSVRNFLKMTKNI